MNHESNNTEKIRVDNLIEREKELQCLYKVGDLLNNLENTLESVIPELLEILPGGWRFPEICEAEIIIGDEMHSRPSLKRTELKLSADIVAYGEVLGEVRIYYTRSVKLEKGIFLSDEQRLLNVIAEKIAVFLTLKKLKPLDKDDENFTQGEGDILSHVEQHHSGLLEWLSSLGLNKHEALELLENPLEFRKGETVGKQGAFTSYFLLLARGYTKSYVEGGGNKSYAFMLSKAFEFIGLSSLFGNNYYFTTTALVPSTVFLVEKETVIKLLHSNPKFNRSLMKWYCDSYKLLFQKMSALSLKQTVGRLADALLYLSEVFESDLIPPSISRKDIAEIGGMSNENAVRILSDFKSEKIVKSTTAGLEILNKQVLKTICATG
jgi:CRP-like cAMP-binding protein